ncbi:MAG: peptidoglycan-binding protein, partial [Planctomycetaceae bacterium]
FGPVTKSAVERFQREHELEVTGIVGPETWKALGPIVSDDEPVPAPAAIASEAAALPVLPAADLGAPPFVTCGAWAIGDAETGEILWNHNGDEPRHMASTTKIMAALVVLELAAKDPAVLDEVVTFSRRADDTRGSTAGIRAGERLSVRELLFGLLLPSGNDAATAFAEHFGPRFDPPAEWPTGADPSDSVEHFIAEMNRAAKRLELVGTTFRNPHGLSADDHRATAADLVRLARAALKHDLFREVVSTRLHGCTVTGAGGYTRNIRWENTNQLLGTAGYTGVKTGTTDAAGACLVSLGECSAGGNGEPTTERRLIVAVLGATSPDARYVDTRNLFRWARRELSEPE